MRIAASLPIFALIYLRALPYAWHSSVCCRFFMKPLFAVFCRAGISMYSVQAAVLLHPSYCSFIPYLLYCLSSYYLQSSDSRASILWHYPAWYHYLSTIAAAVRPHCSDTPSNLTLRLHFGYSLPFRQLMFLSLLVLPSSHLVSTQTPVSFTFLGVHFSPFS
ncbi:unnamed protein product [Dicrocoelium dendriticum]|nr:unnamed protein product [Dicrocoelium dendriticum]